MVSSSPEDGLRTHLLLEPTRPGSGITRSGISPSPHQGTPRPPLPLSPQGSAVPREAPVSTHRVRVARGAFGLAAARSSSKGGVFLNQPSPGRGCSTAQGRSPKGGRSGGSGSISHLACLGNAGSGWGQISREPPASCKPGITQGLREHRKNNPDDILKHNYPPRPLPLPLPSPPLLLPQVCCDYTRRRRLGSRAPTLAPWHLHKERSPAEIIPIYNSSATMFLQTAEVVCAPHDTRPPSPSTAPLEPEAVRSRKAKRTTSISALPCAGYSAPAKNTTRAAAHLERGSESLHVPQPSPAPNYPPRPGPSFQRPPSREGCRVTNRFWKPRRGCAPGHTDGAPPVSLAASGGVTPVPDGKGDGRPLGGLWAGVWQPAETPRITPRSPCAQGDPAASCCPRTGAAACIVNGPGYNPL